MQGIKGKFANSQVTNFGHRHRGLIKKYVSVSKFSSYLSGTSQRQSAKLNQVQLSRHLSGTSAMPASLSDKVFSYVQTVSPTRSATALRHNRLPFWLHGNQDYPNSVPAIFRDADLKSSVKQVMSELSQFHPELRVSKVKDLAK